MLRRGYSALGPVASSSSSSSAAASTSAGSSHRALISSAARIHSVTTPCRRITPPPPRARHSSSIHSSARCRSSSAQAEQDSQPWFLQEEVVQVDPQADEHKTPAHDHAPTTRTRPLPANLPETLGLIHQHLTMGPLSNLLEYNRDGDLDQEEDSQEASDPIEFVDARSTSDVINWCDWVVFITVRENKGGNINARIAQDVGDILKRAGPPSAKDSSSGGGSLSQDEELDMDSLLGPSDRLSGKKDPYGPQSSVRIHAEKLRRAQEAQSELDSLPDEGKELPAWALHKAALKSKFENSSQGTTNWRPLKILSRETQAGLRILHKSDPDKWSVSHLAGQFKVSPESIRRILKAKPERWGGDTREDKGYRRIDEQTGQRLIPARSGPERWVREEEEIQDLRQRVASEQSSQQQQDHIDADDLVDIEEDNRQSPLLNLRSLGKPRHPVRFEGLPLSSSANKTRNKKIAKRATFGGGSIGDTSGSDSVGEWVMVDAGWCVVHVMTPSSQSKYRIQDVWRRKAQVGGFDDLDVEFG
ncbi:unnamed protein product [Sympodiomycopsis kandeliae]